MPMARLKPKSPWSRRDACGVVSTGSPWSRWRVARRSQWSPCRWDSTTASSGGSSVTSSAGSFRRLAVSPKPRCARSPACRKFGSVSTVNGPHRIRTVALPTNWSDPDIGPAYPSSRRSSRSGPGRVPALDLVGLALCGSGVDRGRTDQPPRALLLEYVRGPAPGAGTGEHRGEHVRRNLGEVQDDRRPELDVGLQHPVRATFPQLGERCLLQGLGNLVARGGQLLRRTPKHTRPRILGAVDPVAEPHQALTAVEEVLDVGHCLAALLDLGDHAQDARRSAAV